MSGLDLFSSDLDLSLTPKLPLVEVANALAEHTDATAQRVFKDVDLIRARVPIVSLEHSSAGVSVDLSVATNPKDDSSPVVCSLVQKHPQLVPLGLLLKVLMIQNG